MKTENNSTVGTDGVHYHFTSLDEIVEAADVQWKESRDFDKSPAGIEVYDRLCRQADELFGWIGAQDWSGRRKPLGRYPYTIKERR